MRRDWWEVGWRVGAIAAAATAGALIGFGLRFGTPLRPFNSIAAVLLGRVDIGVRQVPVLVSAVGLVIHVAAMLCWGALYAYLVGRSGGHRWAWAAVTAILAFCTTSLASRALGIGLGTLLPVLDRVALALVLLLALALGMRFAFVPPQRD